MLHPNSQSTSNHAFQLMNVDYDFRINKLHWLAVVTVEGILEWMIVYLNSSSVGKHFHTGETTFRERPSPSELLFEQRVGES